jgi:hypothetical protein
MNHANHAMKQCKGCRHFSAPMWCMSGAAVSPVDGELMPKFALIERKESGRCGPHARMYSAIRTQPSVLRRLFNLIRSLVGPRLSGPRRKA